MQRLVAATAVSLFLATSAMAQTTPAPAPAPTNAAGQANYYRATSDDSRASKLIGTSVKNSAGETIGDINEIVLGKDGRVAAVVIGVGGFLGIGERLVAVSFNALQMTKDSSDKLAVVFPNATKDSLKAAPEWKWASKS